ncbi:MAG: hypothetical protein QM784_38575 [Polyangiaceae bacterium]
MLSAFAAVILLGLGVVVYAGRRGAPVAAQGEPSVSLPKDTEPASTIRAGAEPSSTSEATVRDAKATPASQNPPATREPQPDSGAAAASTASNSGASGEPSANDLVRVLVKLSPSDSKLTYRGVAVPGPPFYVDVPKGKKLYLEASRKGYVTRKVTVDSNRPEITVGLVEPHKK